ncbi:MAG TPA: nitrite reductase [Nocardioides sp.]|nr:nitrite reductase [Nocardioides sp.]
MLPTTGPGTIRSRPDRCPGVLHPWPAADGALVRVRLPGGRVGAGALQALVTLAEEYGDGRVHVTARANLQLRGMPAGPDGAGDLAPEVVAAVERAGLLPSRAHDRARNVLVSPQTGLAGGRADLRPVVADLDRLLLASPVLAGLAGRFLFVLDDGRGDVADRHRDLGLVALSPDTGQLRVGGTWGEVVPLNRAGVVLTGLAERFLALRGSGPDAPWHVDELTEPLAPAVPAAPGADVAAAPLAFGAVDGGEHVEIGPDGIDAAQAAAWAGRTRELVVTPWHGVLVPDAPEVGR